MSISGPCLTGKVAAEDDPVAVFLETIDRAMSGVLKWEKHFCDAVRCRESGTYVLDVRIEQGRVKEVYVQAREKL